MAAPARGCKLLNGRASPEARCMVNFWIRNTEEVVETDFVRPEGVELAGTRGVILMFKRST